MSNEPVTRATTVFLWSLLSRKLQVLDRHVGLQINMNRSVEKWIVGHIKLAKMRMRDARLLDSWGGGALRKEQKDIVEIYCGLQTLRNMLLYWDTGTGKTFTTTAIMHYLYTQDPRWRFLVMIPASLQDTWDKGLRRAFRASPAMRDHVRIVRYNNEHPEISFRVQFDKIVVPKRNRVFIVIDEVHNFISRSMPSNGRSRDSLYEEIVELGSEVGNRLLLLSATPLRNSPREFTYLMHLLRPPSFQPGEYVVTQKGELENREDLKSRIYGVVSTNTVSESNLFEKFERTADFSERNLYVVNMVMSERQSRLYEAMERAEWDGGSKKANNSSRFKTNRRIFSTVAVNMKVSSLKDDNALEREVSRHRQKLEALRFSEGVSFADVDPGAPSMANEKDQAVIDTLLGYSVKFTYVCIQMKKTPGKFLVYQYFVNNYGIEFFASFLKVFDITFMEFSSRTASVRREQLKTFNDPKNDDASITKVCVFSDSGNEGVNYLSVQNLVLIDLPWSYAELEQIVGRGHRLRSHVTLPESQQVLNVYVYIAKTIKGDSVDTEMWDIIERKRVSNNKILRCMKECSFEWLMAQYSSDSDIVPVESEFVFDTLRQPRENMVRSVVNDKLENQESMEIVFRMSHSTALRKGELLSNGAVYEDGVSVGSVKKNERGAYIIEIADGRPVYVVDFAPDNTYLT